MELRQIASFAVDHTKLDPGMYTSRVDGDVVTYDVRMKKPNAGDYFTTGAGHSMEHLFATYVRSGAWSDHVVYVGPMGCRTGFYILVRDIERGTGDQARPGLHGLHRRIRRPHPRRDREGMR